ncbi:MAG: RNA polymerase factor sigma-54 [Pseudomonadota bacterium]
MKQSLQLKIGQQLTMTPQLQQAIKLLQLSSLELELEIQQALEENPLLDVEDEFSETQVEDEAAAEGDADGLDDPLDPELTGDPETFEDTVGVDDYAGDVPDDVPVDSSWEDLSTPSTPSSPSSDALPDTDFEARNSSAETLQDHLLWQLNLTPMTDRDRVIAEAIIESVNPEGLLDSTLEDIRIGLMDGPLDAQTTAEDEDGEATIECAEIEAVLRLLQHFEPTGACARDLRECLMIQLQRLDASTPWRSEALVILDEHIDKLASRDFTTLRKQTKLDDRTLAAAIDLIQTLNPRPGNAIGDDHAEYVVPDVYVRRDGNRWMVTLNPEATPKLRINETYASLIKRADSSPDNQYLRDNLQEARWFMKSLQSRNETLLKVATQIVEHQRAFLDYGEEAMKPLVLHDIADAVEMHESTISRVTTNKYLHTPRGIFELKYFFSSHVSTTTGGEVSSTAIRALIKKMTAEEDPKKPLSDSKIAAILNEQNIKVARRTVAKYRESLAIPPSNERKRLV